ncbi:retrotransposon protein, putative, ty1-copia subclass, partial [Tanacetum coccineum]
LVLYYSITPSPATLEQEDVVNDYKERLVEVELSPDLVVDDFKSCDGDDGSIEQARTFPVELSELVEHKECGVGSPPENFPGASQPASSQEGRDVSDIGKGVTPTVVDMGVEKEKLSSLEDTTVLGSFPPLPMQVTTSANNAPGKSSYANFSGKPSEKKLNIHTLFTPGGNGIDVVVLVESIRAISGRFANTAYGFFLGKRVAYPVVANYVRNTWDVMLENGPWFIRNNLLIMKKWHPDENLLKEDVSIVPVWVKLYGVPVTAFSEDGLSSIATKLGTPLMLDSYTSDMCMQSWGRSSYARVMVELKANVELKDNIVVAMPKFTRVGYYTCNVRVEYEWKPPRCSSCKGFGHAHEECTMNTGAG